MRGHAAMTMSEQLVRLHFVPSQDTTKDEVEDVGAALRAAGADASVEASNEFIGMGEVVVALAIVVTLSEAVKALLDLVDRIKGKVGYTLDARERPALITPNPNLPAGVGHIIWPDGRVETVDKRSTGAMDALQRLMRLVAG